MIEDVAPASHPIDRHVGVRIRLRRNALRMSQGALAAKLGVSFQAVQKYEAGTVRISASRLYDVAQALATNPAFFFDGFAEGGAKGLTGLEDRDMAALLRNFSRIRDPLLQAELRRFIATLGEGAE
ncbi:MAG TPA: helix-turn-helix transcriptional regulator [Stellaceae bacterium]|nr:helix-turn-helix transcriptional regulator [Stellaceae bacterium]